LNTRGQDLLTRSLPLYKILILSAHALAAILTPLHNSITRQSLFKPSKDAASTVL